MRLRQRLIETLSDGEFHSGEALGAALGVSRMAVWKHIKALRELGVEVEVVRGKGYFAITGFIPTDERTTRKYPLLLTTGRILSQYNVGAQTRRTPNSEFYSEDVLEIHPFDAEERGIDHGGWCGIASRAGETVLRAVLTDRVQPGVVYTTFHFPSSGANIITTDNSDWATNCPEYKVTAVQVSLVSEPSQWQKEYREFASRQEELLDKARV